MAALRRGRRMPRRLLVMTVVVLVAAGAFLPSLLAPCPSVPPQPLAGLNPAASAELSPPLWPAATHLIMVAGHAVLTASERTAAAVQSERSWFLEPFQHGQLQTMLSHIRRGVELAAADNASLLVFSGGETRAAAGPRSEAASYWEAAEALHWFGQAPRVRPRAFLEAHARDSLENLLFALCRFREAAGRYPSRGACSESIERVAPPHEPHPRSFSLRLAGSDRRELWLQASPLHRAPPLRTAPATLAIPLRRDRPAQAVNRRDACRADAFGKAV